MTTNKSEMGAFVRDELRALVPDSNEFDTKALEERLENVLALVKQMPNTAKETARYVATVHLRRMPDC